MAQLGELQRTVDELDGPVTTAAIVLQPLDGEDGREVASKTGFSGAVVLDPDQDVARALGAGFGSVVLVDRAGTVRWHKPGTKFKRPRAELVARAVGAVLARDEDPEAVRDALDDLDSGQRRKRERAVARLGELEAVEHRAALEAVLADDAGDDVRAAAAVALGHLRSPAALPALARAAAEDDEEDVRLAAATALVAFGDDYQAYPGKPYRHAYVHAEGRELEARAAELAPVAETLLAETAAELRRLGARLLWRAGDPASRPRLLELLEDDDDEVVLAAIGGLLPVSQDPAVRAAVEAATRRSKGELAQMATLLLEGHEGKIRE